MGHQDPAAGERFQREPPRCPFCRAQQLPDTVSDHCNHCVDAAGIVAHLGRQRKEQAEARVREAEDAARSHRARATDTLRSMVSQNKVRFQESGFDLDLTYITPRCIAMGFPSHGREAYYRNSIEEVERFLDSRHRCSQTGARHYRVYNLCSERHYDKPDRFGGSFARYPFDDHNAPAPLSLIPSFCNDAQQWLAQNPRNVIAVHCKAGKGRTGVMVTSFLMATIEACRSAADALKCFNDARTRDGKGVTIASQMRYVRYWETMLAQSAGQPPPPRRVRLRRIVVHGAIKASGSHCDPYFTLTQGPAERGGTSCDLFDSRKRFTRQEAVRDWGFEWDVAASGRNVEFSGDVKFVFRSSGLLRVDHLFHFWINTALAPLHDRLSKPELDKACKDKKHVVYNRDLAVEYWLEPAEPPQRPPSQSPRSIFQGWKQKK